MRSETDEARFDYYRNRLSGSVLGMYESFTAAVVAAVRRAGATDPGELNDLCDDMLADARDLLRSLARVSAKEFADALIEKGVLSRRDGELGARRSR